MKKKLKYLIILIIILLIITIFYSITFGLTEVFKVFNNSDDYISYNLKEINGDYSNINSLDIDIKYTNLTIKTGNVLKVETNNKYINSNYENNKLIIKEKKHRIKSKTNLSDLIIYVPNDFTFNNTNLDLGIGRLEIYNLITEKLNFDLGSGKVIIYNLVVNDSSKINSGTGEVKILNSTINNLYLDMGVGEFNLTSKLRGNNKIDVGVGDLNLNLIDSIDNYTIDSKIGLGLLKINGKRIKTNNYGTGDNYISIEGGVGSININYK